ncbi:hypothetical protein TVAG_070190 [Trichomonas vaginalis G3]|uniref:Uncharacterized protein n=1 Tax=Trichomonas vaginalis (strain ATCC PRA-98 / G3) TaxID=412133 RepID=A2D7S3_TRIV3|nr:ankyrin repeat protein family [Trichomonas vaginalis G3]EAY23356.1 hypothetical protein TVAG_070190 [Trichomonas vaginalis G3]KAI5493764.1 ankyrin repeat protein family [Trichomonas vaginalis G3]|eukprot:XP_001584342.1 hypothetical protein [Trichomonas vaginalis G3]
MIYSQYLLDKGVEKIDSNADVKSEETYNALKDILQYSKTEIECDKIVLKDLFHIGLNLEMRELCDLYKKYVIDEMELNKSNCIELLEYYFDISSQKDISKCINYISSHFFTIDEESLKSVSKKLGIEIFQRIIGSNRLAIKDEDSLASFIISLTKENEIFNPLIEKIQFEFCSKKIIDEIHSLSNAENCKIIMNSFNDSLLRAINPNKINPRSFNPEILTTEISEYKNSDDFESIYNFLDRLSENGYQDMMYKACQEGLCEKRENEFNRNVLHVAVLRGNFRLVKSLIESGCNKETQDNKGWTPLILASQKGNLEIIKYLISIGANKEAQNFERITPLIAASSYGFLEVVQYLIFIDVNKEAKDKDGNTPLILASFNNHLEVVKYLVFVGANKEAKNNKGWSPLVNASCMGHLEIVKYLISAGADKETNNPGRLTPLIIASRQSQLEVVKYLISVGANKNAKTSQGLTPLIIASLNNHCDIVQYLISIEVDKEAKDNYGLNSLHYASFYGHKNAAEYLISVGLNKEAKTNDGYTPLMLASKEGKLEVVKYLISVGADKEAKGNDGKTPISLATGKVKDFLLSA